MGDDFDGKYMDSVDSSPDISDTLSDVDNEIPVDIPEDVPDSVNDDLTSDASSDVHEDIPEDVPEDTLIEPSEDAPVDIPENVQEDTSTDTAQDFSEDQEGKEPLAEQIEKEITVRDDIKDNPDFIDETGDLKWPENDGFVGEPKEVTLQPGERIDRYGPEDDARFTSPQGTPFEKRSLPFDKDSMEYHVYEVNEPLNVLQGEIAPAYNQQGGGVQHKLPGSLDDEIDHGFLKRV